MQTCPLSCAGPGPQRPAFVRDKISSSCWRLSFKGLDAGEVLRLCSPPKKAGGGLNEVVAAHGLKLRWSACIEKVGRNGLLLRGCA